MTVDPIGTGGTKAEDRAHWQVCGIIILGFVAALYVLELIDTIASNRLDGLGIEPRSLDGLWGVAFSPLLHFGWSHLLANTIPLLVLGYVLLLSGVRRAVLATAIVWLVGGVGVWLIAPAGSITLGASGLVFGWLAYLLLRGLFTRQWLDILVGVVMLVLYGSLLWGLFPGQEGVSWQGHLFGAIGGVLAAWLLGRGDRVQRSAAAAAPGL
ncbi:rhomboid family intramembrane serine protease [Tomitella biformata]|uniref:rhomboid family intramembrane serine protease n=1 Tax=Tomitella biformata TaxID=630403 RepID=UPI00046751DD